MSKTFSLTETNLELNPEYLMNSTMISYVNSFPRIQPWFHDILYSTEFTYAFIILNSYMILLSWIYQHEFRDEFIHTNSDICQWFHDILHDHEFISEFILWIHIGFHDHELWHFMTYEFIYEFMYMKNTVKSYLKSCVPRFQMTPWQSCCAWPRLGRAFQSIENRFHYDMCHAVSQPGLWPPYCHTSPPAQGATQSQEASLSSNKEFQFVLAVWRFHCTVTFLGSYSMGVI